MKIRYYEIIYQQYSRRVFSEDQDRAVAMEGLESKILEAYNTNGRFGVLHCFFHRSLMWQREGVTAMERIVHSDVDNVPTWSWMKVTGAIEYFPIDFDGVKWSEEIKSPFKGRTGLTRIKSDSDLHISAVARDFSQNALVEKAENFFLDRPAPLADVQGLKCVVVATQRQTQQSGLHPLPNLPKFCYVLLVAPKKPAEQSCTEYERVGVAKLEDAHISLNGGGLHVKIT